MASFIGIFHNPTSMWVTNVENQDIHLSNNPTDILDDFSFSRKDSLKAHSIIRGFNQSRDFSIKVVTLNSPMVLRKAVKHNAPKS